MNKKATTTITKTRGRSTTTTENILLYGHRSRRFLLSASLHNLGKRKRIYIVVVLSSPHSMWVKKVCNKFIVVSVFKALTCYVCHIFLKGKQGVFCKGVIAHQQDQKRCGHIYKGILLCLCKVCIDNGFGQFNIG